jgi:hypothetical protein
MVCAILLVLVDAQYKFILIGVCGHDKSCGGGFSTTSALGKSAQASALSIPNAKPLTNSEELLLSNITVVEAFPLNINLLRS